MFVSAGDLIGATPLLSALFHDEPTIEAFNLMDLDYNGVGNHEFDEGVDELLRMAYGNRTVSGYTPASPDGCHPVDGCGDGTTTRVRTSTSSPRMSDTRAAASTIFPPYAIHEFERGARVAFVGMTLEGTPLIVSPGGIASVDFLDEAASVNALVPHLQAQGVRAIVVLLHEGGSVPVSGNGAGDVAAINSCDSPTGAIPPIVEAMDDEIDIVITGHTNWAVNCLIDDKVVTGAASQGRLITDIDARVSPASGDFVGPITVNNRIVTRDVAPDPDLTALIAEYKVFEGPIAAQEVGSASAALTRIDGWRRWRLDPGSADRRRPACGVGRCSNRVHEPGRNPERYRGCHDDHVWRGLRSPAVLERRDHDGSDRCAYRDAARAAVHGELG